MTAAPCPCGGADYTRCCGPSHAGQPAASAEALMRARYSAFVRGQADYLLATWHASTRPSDLQLEAGLKWLGLSVIRSQSTGPETALVEFVARSRLGGGKARRLHEISRFVCEQGRWYYVDGTFPGHDAAPPP